MFSLVCALPSPASAEACASLFDWFTGTTAQSDFSGTCMSAVWFMAFADRSCSFEQDVREISRFSCMLFLSVRGFSDYAGPNSHSRNSVAAVLPSSISERSRYPDPSAFRSSIAPPTGTSGLRFTRHLTVPPARLEARMESLFSFPVGLFHPLQHAGLSRRTPSSRPTGSYRVRDAGDRFMSRRSRVTIRSRFSKLLEHLLCRAEIRTELQYAQNVGSRFVALSCLTIHACEVHADAASIRCSFVRVLPEFNRFPRMPGLRLD